MPPLRPSLLSPNPLDIIPVGQITSQLWRAWLYVTHVRSLAIFFGIGFALLAIALLIASRTRWGQAKPLTKCVALSVLAHVWLLMYVLGTRVVLPQGNPAGHERGMSIAFESESLESELLDSESLDTAPSLLAESPDWQPADAEATQPDQANRGAASEVLPWEQAVPLAELPQPTALRDVLVKTMLSTPSLLPVAEPTPMPPLPAAESDAAASFTDNPDDSMLVPPDTHSAAAQTPAVQDLRPAPPESTIDSDASEFVDRSVVPPTAVLPPEPLPPRDARIPAEYQLRQAPNRLQVAAAFGADADSEAAVQAGLQWLARAQSPDGSWDAKQHGAGTETHALGESRYGTGDKADTGISGLALLAFLSAGHTHLEGEHRATVQRGLQYLLRSQMPSGDLSGPKQVGSDRGVLNARMYCHSIATLALAEAHAMTHDGVLRDALVRASQYSINAQDPRGGGWRYRPLDAGDLSQFGWQAMALKSLERSGIPIPNEVQARMRRFLDACAAGAAGGLATYQPKNGRPSETMTAEGLACRLLLGYPLTPAARDEGLAMIMKNRPGVGEDNVYFWYYATLALFQLQDANWRDWNQALKQQLLTTQLPNYADQPGSWTPDRMWGGYGGRVYSTAMSCLCLEVYYRYLPMYQ